VTPRYDRYERVYHRVLREFGHVLAPGAQGNMVTVQFGGAPAVQVLRKHLRRRRWWERLLDR
jgi:hypothetical protein